MKRSREYRFAQKERIIKKRLNDVRHAGIRGMLEDYDGEMNRLHKTDGFDCGKADCGLCRSPEKYHRGQIRVKESTTKDYEDNDE